MDQSKWVHGTGAGIINVRADSDLSYIRHAVRRNDPPPLGMGSAPLQLGGTRQRLLCALTLLPCIEEVLFPSGWPFLSWNGAKKCRGIAVESGREQAKTEKQHTCALKNTVES
jgi:hypothetical protein